MTNYQWTLSNGFTVTMIICLCVYIVMTRAVQKSDSLFISILASCLGYFVNATLLTKYESGGKLCYLMVYSDMHLPCEDDSMAIWVLHNAWCIGSVRPDLLSFLHNIEDMICKQGCVICGSYYSSMQVLWWVNEFGMWASWLSYCFWYYGLGNHLQWAK